jgi:hypothetical protein
MTDLNIHRILFAVITGSIGTIIIIGNWHGVICSKRTEKSFSCIPFLGGIFAALCIAFTSFRRLFWIGLVMDIGTWSGFIGLPFLIKEIVLRNKDE